MDFQQYFYYFLNAEGYGSEFVETDSTALNAAQILTLPCTELEGVWENLHFDNDVKLKVRIPMHDTCACLRMCRRKVLVT